MMRTKTSRLGGAAWWAVAASLGCSVFLACPRSPASIRIGAILPLSGKSAQYGKFIQEGLELARDEVNRGGGIDGRTLEIVYEDDQATPNLAANAMKKLAEVDKVPVVVGSWASSSVLAQAPIAEANRVIVMAEAVSPKIRDAGDYTFRIQPDGSYYMRRLAQGAYDELGLRKVAVIYVNNDFGIDLAAKFRSDFTARGGTVSSQNGFEQGQSDFRSLLALIAGEGVDGVFVASYAEAGQVLRQARQSGLTQRFLAAATFENPDILEIAGAAAEGVVYPHHFDPNSTAPPVREYQAKYQARYGGRLSEGFAVLAYDGLHVIADGLRACDVDTTCLKKHFYAVKGYQGASGETSFDDKGDVVKPILLKTVRDGKFVAFRPAT